MIHTEAKSARKLDLTTCDREPIHIPGSIQPFGVLLVLHGPEFQVIQASRNTEKLLAQNVESVLARPLRDLIDETHFETIRAGLLDLAINGEPVHLGQFSPKAGIPGRSIHATGHRRETHWIVELEAAEPEDPGSYLGVYHLVRRFLSSLEPIGSVEDLARFAAEEVRLITGFDRVLIYRFDESWDGTVIAESRNEELPSYLGLKFPASDIPAPARELYRRTRLRLIPDSTSSVVPLVPPLNPATGLPLDMSFSTLRSVSPVHLAYMKNMATASSMSISILRDRQLWGLITSHHKTPRNVPFEVRTACDFLGQVLSLQIAAREHREEYEYRMSLKSVQAKLLASMADHDEFADGLAARPEDLLAFGSASGAAVVFGGRCTLVGTTPDEGQVMRLVDWLASHGSDEVFATDSLTGLIPEAESYAAQASGLLAVSISKLHRSYVLWFRPEAERTVRWGGDPRKPFEPDDADASPRPRRSFELWKETIRHRSWPWRAAELDTATELRNAIVGIVLRRAEELAQLSAELKRSNRELEAFSYSVSHDLRAPFRHIVGYSEMLLEEAGLSEQGHRFATTIIESAEYAGVLVDGLLAFAQMGRTALHPVMVDMNEIVENVRLDVMTEAFDRKITWKIAKLPKGYCDPMMIRLALRNLMSNSVKYTRAKDEAIIEIGGEITTGETVYFIRDNGVGFQMQYVDKLFGVFQRLHRMEDYEGTGIGLANVRRIIERHGGRIWAQGEVDAGATFTFTLPAETKPEGE